MPLAGGFLVSLLSHLAEPGSPVVLPQGPPRADLSPQALAKRNRKAARMDEAKPQAGVPATSQQAPVVPGHRHQASGAAGSGPQTFGAAEDRARRELEQRIIRALMG